MSLSQNRQIIVSGLTAEQEMLNEKLFNTSEQLILSPEWQHWLVENHQRQIPHEQLIEIMVREGVNRQIATNAVKSISQQSTTLQLSLGWQQWIQENQLRNVPDEILIETMVQKGIALQMANYAVKAIRTQKKSDLVQKLQPRENKSQENKSVEAQLLAKLESILLIKQQLAELLPNQGIIERRSHISKQEFLEKYYATNTPVILTGMMEDWTAMSSWSPNYFKTNYSDVEVEIQTGRNNDPEYEINSYHHKKTVTLSEYVDMVVNGGETNDYYLVANNGNLEREELKSLLKDIVFPNFLNPDDIKQRIFLWFGPGGTVTPLHHDPLNLMMAHVVGRKRWRLISPNYTPLLYNYVGVFSKVDLEQPDYEKYPLFKQVKVIETVLEPGEIIFIPVGWWHQVKALDVSLSVSFTNFDFPNSYNYQNPSLHNLEPKKKLNNQSLSLSKQENQISDVIAIASLLETEELPLSSLKQPTLTYKGVKNNLTDGYLVDKIFPNELLIISFGFVAWEGVPGFDFYGRTKKLEQLANRPINRILVRDFDNAWYHRGVRGLGDNIDEMCDRIQQLITKISPSRVVTIGQSMGGYAAILFGKLLAVDQVLAFGPLSFLNSQKAIEIGDTRWLSVMQNLETNPPAKCYFDLVELSSPSKTKIDIFYGQKPDPETPGDINLDDIHAQRLATLPNCHLYPYPESGHAIAQYLIDRKLMDSVLIRVCIWGLV